MANSEEKKEIELSFGTADDFSVCILVWQVVKRSSGHYAGKTLEEIVKETKKSQQEIEQALGKLATRDAEQGCLRIQYCQEGTAGPFATRFIQRENITPKFVLLHDSSTNYKLEVRTRN